MGSTALEVDSLPPELPGNMGLSIFWEIVKDREAWHAAAHEVAKSWTQLSDSTTTKKKNLTWETLKTLLSDYNGKKFNPSKNREETEHKILKKEFVPVVDLQVMLQKL